MFINPMWDNESQRIGKQRCTPAGYMLHGISDLIGFIALIFLIGITLYILYLGAIAHFSWNMFWLFLIPLGIAIVGNVLHSYSWHLAAKRQFKYDYHSRTATWVDDFGVHQSYKYDGNPLDSIMHITIQEQLNEIERLIGFRYPLSFASQFEELVSLQSSENFRCAFPDARLLLSAPEVAALRSVIPTTLLPFMSEQQQDWLDIYAFDLDSDDGEFRVVVWSDHATVKEWESFPAFFQWVLKQITHLPPSGNTRTN